MLFTATYCRACLSLPVLTDVDMMQAASFTILMANIVGLAVLVTEFTLKMTKVLLRYMLMKQMIVQLSISGTYSGISPRLFA